MRDLSTGEPIITELPHSSQAYETQYRFPLGYVWAQPRIAWATLREVMPWEALGLSAAICVISVGTWGLDLGVALGISAALALVACQMLRTRTFLTRTRIVWQRGLFFRTRKEMLLSAILGARVECSAGDSRSFGDVVFETAAGEQRVRALKDPSAVLTRILSLRASPRSET